jgi:hypothetical protein
MPIEQVIQQLEEKRNYEADGVTLKADSYDALRCRMQSAIDAAISSGQDMDLDGESEPMAYRIDRAIQVLKGIPSGTIPYKAQTKAVSPATRRKMAAAAPRKTMSAAARRKISLAQKARWAKVKAGKG